MTDRVRLEDTDLDDAMAYMLDGECFTGEVVEVSPTGQITEMSFTGDIVETLSTGEVMALFSVVDDKHGLSRTWYRDGTLETETNMVRGRVVGTSRKWHPNGVLAEELEFDERGKLVTEMTWTPEGEPERR